MSQSLLVIGAREGSLGDAIARYAKTMGFEVTTAGIHHEDVLMDVRRSQELVQAFSNNRWQNVVYTAGVNYRTELDTFGALTEFPSLDDITCPTSFSYGLEELRQHYHDTLDVNFVGGMIALSAWLSTGGGHEPDDSFVGISSNSAHIPRTKSSAYCASKASLSIGIRSVARELSRSEAWRGALYGYEPCWIDDTPMSNEVLEALGPDVPPHKIPGNRGMSRETFAQFIVLNMSLPNGASVLHGSMIRTDLGDS